MPRTFFAAALAVFAAIAGAARSDEPPAPPPTPAPAAAATPVPEPAAPPEEATRSEPDTGATPAGTSGGHRKSGAAKPPAARATPLYTVLAVESGRSLSLRAPDGRTVAFGLTKKTKLPAGLAPGATVTVRAKTSGKKKVATEVRLVEAPAAPATPRAN